MESEAGKQRESVDKSGHDGEDSPHGEDIVEVGYDIICVMKSDV